VKSRILEIMQNYGNAKGEVTYAMYYHKLFDSINRDHNRIVKNEILYDDKHNY
jgi:hypothetical protein